METLVGRSIPRTEDRRLLTGKGRYLADLKLPGTLQVAVLRSPHAHARIVSLDTSALDGMEGVRMVVTADDIAPHIRLGTDEQPVLAGKTVHHLGEAIVAVAAVDRATAEDAVEKIAVEYDPLPAVVDMEAALAESSPAVAEGRPNLLEQKTIAFGKLDEAFAAADVVIRERLVIHRASAHPLETRGVMATVDPIDQLLTVWCTTQSPHDLRLSLAEGFDLPATRIRVQTVDVGGSFGVKNRVYPEDYLVAWMALQLGGPVQWIEDRHEHFTTTQHEREQIHELELAARSDGTLLGLRDRYYVDNGAYARRGNTVMQRTAMTIPGPYHLPAFSAEGYLIRTHKTPIGPYRGAGRPQGCFVMERMMDRLAQELGVDRAEIRKKNLIGADEFPYETGFTVPERVIYDSGNFPKCLESALDIIEWDRLKRYVAEERKKGRFLGVGLACNVEDTGGAGFEGARIVVDAAGRVRVYSGAVAQGQGHETVYAQVAADVFGIDMDRVEVVLGDTRDIELSIGTFGSRATVLAGSAVHRAAESVRDQMTRWAAYLLETAPEDLTWESGRISVAGVPSRSIAFDEIAKAANPRMRAPRVPQDLHLGLEDTHYFHPEAATYASGAQAVLVELDPRTCQVKWRQYVVVHDCGNVINPQLVDGQIHGGVLHGLSTALYEELVYDEGGQLSTSTYMDYLIPTAAEMPHITTAHLETPSPRNPLGVKGAGESGTIPALEAIASAVEDALSPWGILVRELPISPERIFQWIREARAENRGPDPFAGWIPSTGEEE